MSAPKGTDAASANGMPGGIGETAAVSAIARYSAFAPRSPMPNTRWPGRKRETSAPTASTTPANSMPGIGWRGPTMPKASRSGSRKMASARSPRSRASPEVTVLAWTRTSTSPRRIAGGGTSSTRSTSGGP